MDPDGTLNIVDAQGAPVPGTVAFLDRNSTSLRSYQDEELTMETPTITISRSPLARLVGIPTGITRHPTQTYHGLPADLIQVRFTPDDSSRNWDYSLDLRNVTGGTVELKHDPEE
ncbi:MAG: hypothetical protein AB7O52_11180 [Planctomycetota bacterium]